MKRVLFVSNGHGEVALASRIAAELAAHGQVACDHLALVGDFAHSGVMRDVGPRRSMPSGGLLAMGNVRNIVRDVRAGLLSHTLAQLRFLNGSRGTYAAAVAVGDIFALLMAQRARACTAFVGTAKSVYVAPYGQVEERIMRGADLIYVRDDPTAERLRAHGIAARAGNVIVDLYAYEGEELGVAFDPYLAVFPGSRAEAYEDARFLSSVLRELARLHPRAGATLSIAPGLDPSRMSAAIESAGLSVQRGRDERFPFSAFVGDREIVRAWGGPIGAMLQGADIVMGQAGTANEAAAAAGIPVVAFAPSERGKHAWYRRRQAGLLGDSLLLLAGDAGAAAGQVSSVLTDRERRERMGNAGRARMGAPGAAKRIARDLSELIA